MFPASVPFAFQCENFLMIHVKIHVLSSVVCQLIKVLNEFFIPAPVRSFFFHLHLWILLHLYFSIRTSNLTIYVKHAFSSSASTDHFKIPCNSPNVFVNVKNLVLLGALLLKSWLIFLTPFQIL